MSVNKIGVIGGGQLAWMMAGAAQKLGIELIIQTPNINDPAVSIAADTILAPVDDGTATANLANLCDVITFENEFVNLQALQELESQGVCFRPNLTALSPLLDKYQQRSYLEKVGLPVPFFWQFGEHEIKFPVVIKARRHGYDGQGTFIVRNQAQLNEIHQQRDTSNLMVEEFIPFEQELAVMAARSVTGEVVVYPVVETQQENQVCHRVMAPAKISSQLTQKIEKIAKQLLNQLGVVGIFGIELFLTPEGKVLVNEIAPRTHNSGHYTLDACDISQFEMHLRAVAGLSLNPPQFKSTTAVMINLLGYEHSQDNYIAKRQKIETIPQAYVHWYGKKESRPGRKLGHVTVLLNSQELVEIERISHQIESIWYD